MIRKKMLLCVLFLILLVINLDSQSYEYELLIDPYLNMESGASAISSLFYLYGDLSENFYDIFSFDESIFEYKMLASGLRILKGGIFDSFLGFSLAILQHEYFGHGARNRMDSLIYDGYPVINFVFQPRFSFFPPFYTLFDIADASNMGNFYQVPEYEVLTLFYTGGSEGNFILSELLRKNMIAKNKIDYYSSILFLQSRLDLSTYILFSTDSDSINSRQGDIGNYLYSVNSQYGYAASSENYKLTLEFLQWNTMLSFFDPFIFYCLYMHFHYYLTGQTHVDMPFLWIGDLYFIPYLDMQLSPYGCDRFLRVQGGYNDVYFSSYFRIGDFIFTQFWGMGLYIDNLFLSDTIRWGMGFDFWVQPHDSIEEAEIDLGGAINLNIAYIVGNISLKLKVGAKTKGYVPGLPFNQNIYGSIGIKIE